MKTKSIRIGKVYLKNFNPTFVSMGIKEICFDRSNSKNDLVLILGENGSGKSFLLTELSPEPLEHVNGRVSNRFIEGEEGKKEITYIVSNSDLEDTDEYKSTIIYSQDHKKTTCHLSHRTLPDGEEVELNPNGNVSSYLEMCEKYLGYSKNYKNIGYLSSDVKNVVNMGYGERQQLISSWLPNTSEFLQAGKLAMKKRNQAQREIDGLTKDISKVLVGDIDSHLKEEEEKLLIKKAKLDKTKDGISKASLLSSALNKYDKDTLKANIKEYTSNVLTFNSRLSKNKDDILKYNKYLSSNNGKEKLIEDIHKLDIERESLSFKEQNCNGEIVRLTSQIEQLSLKANDSNNTSGYTIISVSSSIEENQRELSNIENLILAKKANEEEYNIYVEYIPEYKTSSQAAISALMNIALITTKIESTCGMSDLQSVFDNKLDVDSEIENLKQSLKSLEEQLENLNIMLRESDENSINFESVKSYIPDKCSKDICPLINILIERSKENKNSVSNTTRTKINEVTDKINETRHIIEEKNILKQNIQNAMFDVGQVTDILKGLDSNMVYLPDSLKLGLNPDTPYTVLSNTGKLLEIAKAFDEFVSLLEKRKSIKESLNNLNNISKILSMSEENKRVLDDCINRRKEVSDELKSIIARIKEVNEEKETLNSLNSKLSALTSEKEELKNVYGDLCAKKEELLSYNKYLYAKSTINVCLKNLRDLEFSLNKDVSEITSKIEGYKSQLTSVDVLTNRKANTEVKRDLYDLAYKVWCSDGYPSLLINDFLEEVTDFTNKDLDASWGGMLNIEKPKLDSSSLKIPVIRGETKLEDVNECSKAEKSTLDMAIAFGIIEASTENSIYNIIRADEIDGPMDSSRKQSFLDILQQRLRDINCRNCFCITHSNCFESIDCDVILLKGYEKSVSESSLLNKNIIYRYDKSI